MSCTVLSWKPNKKYTLHQHGAEEPETSRTIWQTKHYFLPRDAESTTSSGCSKGPSRGNTIHHEYSQTSETKRWLHCASHQFTQRHIPEVLMHTPYRVNNRDAWLFFFFFLDLPTCFFPSKPCLSKLLTGAPGLRMVWSRKSALAPAFAGRATQTGRKREEDFSPACPLPSGALLRAALSPFPLHNTHFISIWGEARSSFYLMWCSP